MAGDEDRIRQLMAATRDHPRRWVTDGPPPDPDPDVIVASLGPAHREARRRLIDAILGRRPR